jgi:hypothetical protein
VSVAPFGPVFGTQKTHNMAFWKIKWFSECGTRQRSATFYRQLTQLFGHRTRAVLLIIRAVVEIGVRQKPLHLAPTF